MMTYNVLHTTYLPQSTTIAYNSADTTALISDTTEKVDSVAQFSNISPTPPADSILSKLNRKITRRILFICFSCILILGKEQNLNC